MATLFNGQAFQLFTQIDSFPCGNSLVVIDFKLSWCFWLLSFPSCVVCIRYNYIDAKNWERYKSALKFSLVFSPVPDLHCSATFLSDRSSTCSSRILRRMTTAFLMQISFFSSAFCLGVLHADQCAANMRRSYGIPNRQHLPLGTYLQFRLCSSSVQSSTK